MKRKISKLSQQLVDNLTESAKSRPWGYLDDKAALERRIGRLERHIKKLQHELAGVHTT